MKYNGSVRWAFSTGALFLLVFLSLWDTPAFSAAPVPPAPLREFRGVWVATVANIDWPSHPGLPADRQQAELLDIFDRAAALHLNAIILQIRPACDALYASPIEPWSEYLSGSQGQPPDPYYDPLAFAITEAHRRGLELHAWINPYRARHEESKSSPCPTHISQRRPDLARPYGKSIWLDPGEKEVQNYSVGVILDIVRRYDVDAIHIDDYFYPYKERGPDGKILDFPDEPSWSRYQQAGGTLSRDDWRRHNVDQFIDRIYHAIKREKPWVKFGISPFGIWRPGYPEQIKGFDAYQEIYADSRKWLQNGWLDYWTPQLYWPIRPAAQGFSVLLKWWVEQNSNHRHIWPGCYTSRVGNGSKSAYTTDEVIDEVLATRRQPGATGDVHFSMRALLQDKSGLVNALATRVYSEPALIPASPWLGGHTPGKPEIIVFQKPKAHSILLRWKASGHVHVWQWVVQSYAEGVWTTEIMPQENAARLLSSDAGALPTYIAISGVDRYGNQGLPRIIAVRPHETNRGGSND